MMPGFVWDRGVWTRNSQANERKACFDYQYRRGVEGFFAIESDDLLPAKTPWADNFTITCIALFDMRMFGSTSL